MEIRRLSTAEELTRCNAWVRKHPDGSLWQSAEWGKFQGGLGREIRTYALVEGPHILSSALVVIDRTAFGLSTWDIPRGPLWDLGLRTEDLGNFLAFIVKEAENHRCLSLYWSSPQPTPGPRPFVPSPSLRHEQPEATRIIDLTLTEEAILRQMKPKGRYNISVAEKHGVRVQQTEDIGAFFSLIKKTGHRDNFSIHSRRHYEVFLRELPGSFLCMAHTEQGAPIAGLLGVIWGSKAYYYYGASDHEYRALMAPYALQWAAILHCKAAECTTYDLLGIAPEGSPLTHPWQGVSSFKEKFGGQVVTYPPEQQVILRPVPYRLLQLKRKLLG